MKNKKLVKLFIMLIFVMFITSCKKNDENSTNISLVLLNENIENDGRAKQIYDSIQNNKKESNFNYYISNNNQSFNNRLKNILENKKNDLIVVDSFLVNNELENAAESNPNSNFIAIDTVIDPIRKNVNSILFKTEESSYLAGYLAGLVTKTNKIGYVGPTKGLINDPYEYGFKAGILQASKELKKSIDFYSQNIDDFNNEKLGSEIADKMYEDGVDIIYQTVWNTGLGIIESARKNNKYYIGFDEDQSKISPSNHIISVLKRYDNVIKTELEGYLRTKKIDGSKKVLGIKEGAVGVSKYQENNIYDKKTYDKILPLIEKIKKGEIKIPFDIESYDKY
ncbi:BMP family ABC transporter substrate-binding protein [Helcococcus bovis]|uniref:BMP family ABC transporter substrate-binding protein n=1 Tax=Helcococcus bovis TaxID=3153252 RepID=UPI0038BDEADE